MSIEMPQVFAALSPQQIVGQWHDILFYIPLLLFYLALLADLLNYFGKRHALIFGHWLIIAGVVFCMPTLATGLVASSGFSGDSFLLEKHRYLGFLTAIFGSFYAGLRISSMIWTLPLKPAHYVFLSFLLAALISWASDYGFFLE